jgi:hypothetical protein
MPVHVADHVCVTPVGMHTGTICQVAERVLTVPQITIHVWTGWLDDASSM